MHILRFVNSLALAAVLSLKGYAALAQPKTKGTLYFLNDPESIKAAGVLNSFAVRASERTRIFFHYRNATKGAQRFGLSALVPFSGLVSGVAKSPNPGTAGSKATQLFMKALPNSAASALCVSLTLKADETISGIIEGYPLRNGFVVVRMGEGTAIPGAKIYTTKSVLEPHYISLTGKSVSFRFGDRPVNQIAGQYGTTIMMSAKNVTHKTMWLSVSVSARGGALTFPYLYRGTVFLTALLKPRLYYRLFIVDLRPDEVFRLDTIPSGGWSYPIEVKLIPMV